jgi:AraC-like DNA-binding protein
MARIAILYAEIVDFIHAYVVKFWYFPRMRKHEIPHPDPSLAELLEDLPMIVFYMKDRDGAFIRCNRRFEEFHGLPPGGALGLTDHDLHEAGIAERYRAEDMEVMKRGVPTPNRTWLVPGAKGILRWWVSRKAPLRGNDGKIHGIAGVMYEISVAAGMTEPFARLEPALKRIHTDESGHLSTAELAASCNYSESQFNRVFRGIMGSSPRSYVLRHRLETAKNLLARTDLPLSDIALRCGFYDASDFGKRFREQEGLTPRNYRMKLQGMIRTKP